ncbi:ribonuclease E inhibitor RraB [Motilibacter aurantiacus]|uniref:ribonuclease E inhibitor RraB n=1 Tax=Motilibacter aurantiacus TaxID=2714955 RepID=UPI001408A7CB|nr:ribonuclease E inhibitor RraB [Motilibacter aurantiacus]NHC44231.1 ribonuclease E inhibitor RraB [Motilibacter aurantiacus]
MSVRVGTSSAAGALALLLAISACSGDDGEESTPAGPSATSPAPVGSTAAEPAVPPLAGGTPGAPAPAAPSAPAAVTPSAPRSSGAPGAPAAQPSPAGTSAAGFGGLAAADQQVVAQALARGLKAGQPVAVEHRAQFSDQPTLDSVSTELSVLGLTVTPLANIREADSFELSATSFGTLDETFLKGDLAAVREVVERNGGTYTGWDAQQA